MEEERLSPAEKVDRRMMQFSNELKEKMMEFALPEEQQAVIMDYFNKATGGAVVNCLTLEVFADMVSRKIGQQKASKMLSEAITQTIVMTGNQEKRQAKKDN